jgi:DNA-binding IclR family transcriptional regulator
LGDLRRGIALPIRQKHPLAACSVCAPEHRITESRAPILAQLRQCALARKKVRL